MSPDEWLEALRKGMAAVAATPPEYLGRGAPSCPGWTARDVVAHLGGVHRWAVGVVVGEKVPYTDVDPDAPAGEPVIGWYSNRADNLVAALTSKDLDAPTKSPFGERPVRFWYRRQANEVAVHRWDIEHAYRGWDAEPIDAVLAADGIGEWSELFTSRRLGRDGGTPEDLRGTRILLQASEAGGSWLLRVDAEAIGIVEEDATPDATITASTSDLLLALWHRVPLSRLTVDGDGARVERVLDLVRI
ncbi:maleylpyruvate isomerase family mycothiol-dependent enzyme [Mycobacterium sp. D16Q16]|uniref:maleylpyruvate isomerase family mycothiol-dependent enzyme n=1 Tax=Mycobacterium sp. D16Q16 TaxID=1855659 RepID=UPI000992FFEC|nr:maleylpyruvate isomerase family mycothiol-dependent enzyme [Mycobacterium sp. D16Q16]